MPSRIRPGYGVSARLGPYVLEQIGDKNGVPSTSQPSEGDPKKKSRKVRSVIHGWVVGPGRDSSKTKNTWRVLWKMCAKSCDHNSRSLTVTCDIVMNFEREVAKRLLDVDYYMKKEQLFALFEIGGYSSKLTLAPTDEQMVRFLRTGGKLLFDFKHYMHERIEYL